MDNIENAGADKDETLFDPPLYVQRAQYLSRFLKKHNCRSLIDAGCSTGSLLHYILSSRLTFYSIERAVAIDIDSDAIKDVQTFLPLHSRYLHPLKVELVQGDLTVPCPAADLEWLGETLTCDAVFSFEVVEHIRPHLVAAYTDNLFARLGAGHAARFVLLTTPNRDENVRFDSHPTSQGPCREVPADWPQERSVYSEQHQFPRRRHEEHYFEWTRRQFEAYCTYVSECYAPYWSLHEFFGAGDNFTQGAVFVFAGMDDGAPNGTSTLKKDPESGPLDFVYERNERRKRFPFQEIFGMSEEDYREEFKQLYVEPTLSVYKCLYTTEMKWDSLWSRLCSLVRNTHAQWSEELKEATEAKESKETTTRRSKRSSQRASHPGTNRATTSASVTRNKTAKNQKQIKSLYDLSRAYKCIELDPFQASLLATYRMLREQYRLWTMSLEKKTNAWTALAQTLKIPRNFAFMKPGKGEDSNINVTSVSGERVVFNSQAHKALKAMQSRKEHSQTAANGLNLLNDILFHQIGVRILNWILLEMTRQVLALRQQKMETESVHQENDNNPRNNTRTGVGKYECDAQVLQFLEKTDSYGETLLLSKQLRYLIFFMAAVDALPSVFHFLKDPSNNERIRVACKVTPSAAPADLREQKSGNVAGAVALAGTPRKPCRRQLVPTKGKQSNGKAVRLTGIFEVQKDNKSKLFELLSRVEL